MPVQAAGVPRAWRACGVGVVRHQREALARGAAIVCGEINADLATQ